MIERILRAIQIAKEYGVGLSLNHQEASELFDYIKQKSDDKERKAEREKKDDRQRRGSNA